MKVKTCELTGLALRWAAAKAEGQDVFVPAFAEDPWLQLRTTMGAVIMCPQYEADWAWGGPIIDREDIAVMPMGEGQFAQTRDDYLDVNDAGQRGPTKLVAAMRCFVASKLGAEVDVPEELLS